MFGDISLRFFLKQPKCLSTLVIWVFINSVLFFVYALLYLLCSAYWFFVLFLFFQDKLDEIGPKKFKLNVFNKYGSFLFCSVFWRAYLNSFSVLYATFFQAMHGTHVYSRNVVRIVCVLNIFFGLFIDFFIIIVKSSIRWAYMARLFELKNEFDGYVVNVVCLIVEEHVAFESNRMYWDGVTIEFNPYNRTEFSSASLDKNLIELFGNLLNKDGVTSCFKKYSENSKIVNCRGAGMMLADTTVLTKYSKDGSLLIGCHVTKTEEGAIIDQWEEDEYPNLIVETKGGVKNYIVGNYYVNIDNIEQAAFNIDKFDFRATIIDKSQKLIFSFIWSFFFKPKIVPEFVFGGLIKISTDGSLVFAEALQKGLAIKEKSTKIDLAFKEVMDQMSQFYKKKFTSLSDDVKSKVITVIILKNDPYLYIHLKSTRVIFNAPFDPARNKKII